jgi:nucleoside triphosphate pyrophosphatase
MTLVLASASPRRAALLTAAGYQFTRLEARVDEGVRPGETPREHVVRLARAKAVAVAQGRPGATVIGADTVVVADDDILGKPSGVADACRMLERLSGRRHLVYTGVAIWHREELLEGVEISAVEMARLTPDEISWYVASGEPLDKAGAYGIQGLASRFVTRVEGSYSNVVGLPIAMVYRLLEETGRK